MSVSFREKTAGSDQNDQDPRGQRVEVDLATRSVLPEVVGRKPASDAVGVAVGVLGVALLGGITLWAMSGARQAQPATVAAPVTSPAPAALPTPAPITPPTVPPQAITDVPPPAPPPAPNPVVQGSPAPANHYASPTVVYDATAPSSIGGPVAGGQVALGPAAPTGGDDFTRRIGGVGGGPATATASFNPTTTIAQGTMIPAVLETAINTDLPGYVRAVVSADIRSFDGKAVLVPRSSRLVGEYKSGLQAGQKRAYVIWTRLIRPDGISVALNSPAVTFSGETGLAGRVNSHFFERFGSAMLLSVVGNLGNIIGNNSSTIVLGGCQSAAAAAIGQTGQIAPTVKVRQGLPIRVFTARDLDFSKAPLP